jgi:hypothetical protein
MSGWNRRLALALAVVAGGALSSSGEASAQQATSFTLAPGETRSFNIGFYREIRVCNNVGSAGTVDMTVGGQPSTTLAPGVCWRNSGDSLVLHNGSAGSVTGVYNANQTRPGRSGGGGGR